MTHLELADAALARHYAFERQGGTCLRCHQGMSPDSFEAHHRRRRRVLGWCGCNVVALHPRCHTQGELAVHDHPTQAKMMGLIVPTTGLEPWQIPVHTTWPWAGPAHLTCDWMIVSPDALDNPLNLP